MISNTWFVRIMCQDVSTDSKRLPSLCILRFVILKHSTALRGIHSPIHQRLDSNYGSLCLSQPTPPPSSSWVSRWWFMFRMAHVNQLLINPNGVNECQPGCEWFAPALINMTSHIHTANHWLSDWETHTYTNTVVHLMLTLVLRVMTLDGGPNERPIACQILGRYTESKNKY